MVDRALLDICIQTQGFHGNTSLVLDAIHRVTSTSLTEDETITKEPRQLHNENLDLLIYIFWIHIKCSRILFCGLCLLCFKVEMFTFK
jgi:hypothetical protein